MVSFEPTEDYPYTVKSASTRRLIENLKHEKSLMADYLRVKLSNEDWHGVQDAASDLRDIEAKLEVLED